MKNNKFKYPPYLKDFYRISKERHEAYLDKLSEASGIIKEIRPDNDKGDVSWEKVDKAWRKIIDVLNSLLGFRYYEDAEAGAEIGEDTFLYDPEVGLDNDKFFKIEFPNGIKEEVKI